MRLALKWTDAIEVIVYREEVMLIRSAVGEKSANRSIMFSDVELSFKLESFFIHVTTL